MSSVLGATGEPGTGQLQYGTTNNQVMQGLAVPAGGPWLFSQVGFWAAGVNGSSPTVYACIWHGNGTIVGYSVGVTLTNRGFALNGSDLYQLAITSPPGGAVLTGGLTYYFGWQRDYGAQHQYGYLTGNTHVRYTNSSTPGGIVGGQELGTNQQVGAYGIYDPYITNVAPNQPNLLVPGGSANVIITGADLTPAFSFRYSDPDGNNMSAYQIQLDDSPYDFATPVWDTGKVALVQANNTTVTASPPSNLTRGVTYGWRARVWDSSDVVGNWGYST